jgi:hypothetical protein
MTLYIVSARRLSDGHTIEKSPRLTTNELNEAIDLAKEFSYWKCKNQKELHGYSMFLKKKVKIKISHKEF